MSASPGGVPVLVHTEQPPRFVRRGLLLFPMGNGWGIDLES